MSGSERLRHNRPAPIAFDPMSADSLLNHTLSLPCGAVLPNRLCKAALTEGVADDRLRATSRHETLYRRWSEGGAGLLLTGNVQIDRHVLERPGNVAIDLSDPSTHDGEARARLSRWARAGTIGGNHLWMQISHAGRQSPRYVTTRPLAPSAEQLGRPLEECRSALRQGLTRLLVSDRLAYCLLRQIERY